MNLLLVVLGGGIGAGGRYSLGGWLHGQLGSGFPWGTFAVNALAR
jgi:CrcB protein